MKPLTILCIFMCMLVSGQKLKAQDEFAEDNLDLSIEQTLDEEFLELDEFEEEELGAVETLEENLEAELDAADDTLPAQEPIEENFAADELDSELDNMLNEEDLNMEAVEEDLNEDFFQEDPVAEQLPIEETPALPEEAPVEDVPAPEIVDQMLEEEPVVEEVPEPEVIVDESFVEPAPVAVSPDLEREAILDRMFQNYSERIGDEDWVIVAGEYLDEVYEIQRGDTLWDISATLFGSGYFWPKLWQLNSEITNPHIIQPGKVLQFRPGSWGATPEVQVVEMTPEEAGISGSARIDEGEEATVNEVRIVRQPVIPPPKRRKPVLKRVPPSLPYLGRSESGYDADGFAMEQYSPTIQEAVVTLEDILVEDFPDDVGEVVEIESWNKSATNYQYVYIDSETAKVGDVFLTFKEGKLVEHPENGDNIGYMMNIQGEIKVVYTVNADENIHKAQVIRSVAPITTEAKLIRARLIDTPIGETGPEKNVRGQIVGGRFKNVRRYLGKHSTVFLNRGTTHGLQRGDILTIIKNPALRKEAHYSLGDPKPIGKLKIAQVEEEMATAIVLSAFAPIIPGDFTGSAPVLTRQQYEQYKKEQKAGIIEITGGEDSSSENL